MVLATEWRCAVAVDSVTLADVEAAQARIRPHIHRTPLLHSATLSNLTGTNLWLKAENLQKTGSFKPRGAINAALQLTPEECARGVIGVSAGNYAAALAFGARMAGSRATLVMPETAPRSKIAATQGYGGEVILVEGHQLMERLEEVRREQGQTFIHPFDHPQVIAGHGSLGLELAEHLPDLEVVVVPVGGGGLISGIATALKALTPGVVVVGVEPEGSDAVSQSLAAGHPIRLERFQTIADGLNAPWSAPNSFAIIQRLVDEVITLSDEEIVRAMALILERTKLLVEPAGAAAVAALLAGRVSSARGKRTVAILSGGNMDLARLGELVASPVAGS
jgi:threonine dehydratase